MLNYGGYLCFSLLDGTQWYSFLISHILHKHTISAQNSSYVTFIIHDLRISNDLSLYNTILIQRIGIKFVKCIAHFFSDIWQLFIRYDQDQQIVFQQQYRVFGQCRLFWPYLTCSMVVQSYMTTQPELHVHQFGQMENLPKASSTYGLYLCLYIVYNSFMSQQLRYCLIFLCMRHQLYYAHIKIINGDMLHIWTYAISFCTRIVTVMVNSCEFGKFHDNVVDPSSMLPQSFIFLWII